MKLSKYNYIIDRGKESYWFNGVTSHFFVLSKELSDKVNYQLTCDIRELSLKSPAFYQNLKRMGFVIGEKVDEFSSIKEKFIEVVNKKDYFLVILPTLNCNFSCWYCVQEHINTKMNKIDIEKIKKHIHKAVMEDNISSLEIQWFGGEPFMYFDEVILPISEYAMDICKRSGISFANSATTNGYYLSPSLLNKLAKYNFRYFQITLDGVRTLHNKVKYVENRKISTFDTVLENIDFLLSETNNITFTIRLNYNKKNLDINIVEQLNEKIKIKNREKISIAFKKLWQEGVDTNRTSIIREISQKFLSNGYKIDNEIENGCLSCYTDKKWYNAINFDGSVVKCTASDDLYSKNPPGKLQEDGSILWRKNYIENYFDVRFENEICKECKNLPLCMGNCNKNYNENTKQEFVCNQNIDVSFENRIINYIEYENFSN